MKTTYTSVDIAKFFACLCIVLLHTKALKPYITPTDYFYLEKGFLRMGVPFFFVTSGYFLGRKLFTANPSDVKNIIFAYCKRLIYPLVFFSFINIAEHLYTFYMWGDTLMKMGVKVMRSIIFYPYGALWFVQACIVAALLLIPFVKKNKIELALGIGCIMFLCTLLFNSYYFLIYGSPIQKLVDIVLKFIPSLRNGLTMGLVYLSIGILISKTQTSLPTKKYVILGGVILSVICLALELNFVWHHLIPKDDSSLYISQLIVAPIILWLLLNTQLGVRYSLSITFRNLSTGIFYLHKPIMGIVVLFGIYDMLCFAITFISALCICLIAYRFDHPLVNKLLK